MKLRLSSLLLVLSLTSLTACGSGAVAMGPENCPHPAMIQELRQAALFNSGSTDVSGELANVRITGVAGACSLANQGQAVKVVFKAGFIATNGPANHGAALKVPYIVVVALNDAVVEEFHNSVTVKFDGNATQGEATASPEPVILPNDDASSHEQVLIGLDLTPAELAYAQAHPSGS